MQSFNAAVITLLCLLALSGCQDVKNAHANLKKVFGGSVRPTIRPSNENLTIQPNTYGPGVHSDQYGRPVELRPDYNYVPGERLQIKRNAYGPGVHMDQYGRPVRAYPR